MANWKLMLLAAVVAVGLIVGLEALKPGPRQAEPPEPTAEPQPFGGTADRRFADSLWDVMEGYASWPMQSPITEGGAPHGAFVRVYYNPVTIDGSTYHVIVKDNYGGEGASLESVREAPDDHLAAVTVMAQREPGYDPDNDNWFWVKYLPDGSLDTNPEGTALAGRVAKGSDTGCIACHQGAGEGDYVFTNDR